MNYPTWKAALWRFVRVFLVSFFASASIQVLTVDSVDTAKVAIASCGAAAVAAVFKALRDEVEKLSSTSDMSALFKLVITKFPL